MASDQFISGWSTEALNLNVFACHVEINEAIAHVLDSTFTYPRHQLSRTAAKTLPGRTANSAPPGFMASRWPMSVPMSISRPKLRLHVLRRPQGPVQLPVQARVHGSKVWKVRLRILRKSYGWRIIRRVHPMRMWSQWKPHRPGIYCHWDYRLCQCTR